MSREDRTIDEADAYCAALETRLGQLEAAVRAWDARIDWTASDSSEVELALHALVNSREAKHFEHFAHRVDKRGNRYGVPFAKPIPRPQEAWPWHTPKVERCEKHHTYPEPDEPCWACENNDPVGGAVHRSDNPRPGLADILRGAAQRSVDQPFIDQQCSANPRAALFQSGNFTLNSGRKATWKIECDALTDEDVATMAAMLAELLPPFGDVVGVPRGGLRLAAALERFTSDSTTTLIADDVLTTGGSLERMRASLRAERDESWDFVGAVLFARGPCPSWITPLFSMPGARSETASPEEPKR